MGDSGCQIEIDRITASEWSESLDLFEDANIYQTWPYGAVRWGQRNLSHLVLKRDGQIVAMAQLRIVRPGSFKCGIAHLRWGPLCHGKNSDLDVEMVRNMATALREEYVLKRGLFLRVLPNAFTETPRAKVFQTAFSDYETEPFGPGETYRTFVLDLNPPLDVLRKQLDQKWRNQLNRAEKNGLKILEGSGQDAFQSFIQMFEQMWARKRFDTSSEIQEFERMQRELPPNHRLRVLICEQEGVPVAGVVGTALGNSGIYLFGATSDQGMNSKGSYILQWRMIQLLKENGIRFYNLGGINPEKNPGVYHFKQGLSGQDVLYLPPLFSCASRLSTAFVRVGAMANGRLRRTLTRLLRAN
jgi:lipid II:glycine glycyltransferase (peptidoglycan interpeptide bridge formation enzyme)